MSSITTDQGIVHYEVYGRGRPVILLHGWLGSWGLWQETMAYLGQFLLGVAKSADDIRLFDAARALTDSLLAAGDIAPDLTRLRRLVDERLAGEQPV